MQIRVRHISNKRKTVSSFVWRFLPGCWNNDASICVESYETHDDGMKSVSAILLSAGSSQRMGTPKALLKIGDKTFLQHLVDVVQGAGITDVHIVLGAETETLRSQLSWYHGNVVVNADWQSGQLSSIITGINSLNAETCSGILVCPVDHPLVTSPVIKELVRAFEESKKQIVVPTYQGRRGHPIILSSKLFQEIKDASAEIGLRNVVHAHEDDICEVATEEQGVLINVDTPDDYQKYIVPQHAKDVIGSGSLFRS
jgi:CTP:molybdopterin cytidylyltransferase MocA